MAVRGFEISDLINKSEIFSTQLIDGCSFRIRVRYSSNTNYSTRKYVVKIFGTRGFSRLETPLHGFRSKKMLRGGGINFLQKTKSNTDCRDCRFFYSPFYNLHFGETTSRK